MIIVYKQINVKLNIYVLYNYKTIQYIQTRVRRQEWVQTQTLLFKKKLYQMEKKHTAEIVDIVLTNNYKKKLTHHL